MYLSEIKITGYKVFNEEFNIKFNEGLTVLIGENGCGKTAVIDAIRLLLNEDEYGRFGISDNHFHRPLDKKVGEGAASIQIKGVFAGLSAEQQVAYLPWLDATDNTKAYLSKKIENKQNGRGRYDASMWGGESSSGVFEWELLNAINCIYLPPLRDAENKLEAFRGSRLSRLFKKDKPKKGHSHELETKVKEFNETLLKESVISKANEAIRKYLRESLGVVLGQDALMQFSESSFERIVERLRLLFYPKINHSGTSADLFREISENSLGYNNILYLATVLAELDGLDASKTMQKVLLIEEPEAHLHPQLQIRLLQYLKKRSCESDIQVIVTTHSSTITASTGLTTLNVLTLSESGNPKSTRIADCGLNTEQDFFLSRWLDITKSTLFFAKGILFVEGIAEALVIKELANRVIAKYVTPSDDAPTTLDHFGVSIINLNGIYFKHFMQLFQGYKVNPKDNSTDTKDSIPILCAGITDCDPRPVDSTKPTFDNKCDCGNSHSVAFAAELESSSPNCRIFFNLKTFEYDLGMIGNNLALLYKICHEGYTYQVADAKLLKEKSEKDWRKETDKSTECLSLLYWIKDDEGKGMFAQKLAKKLADDPNLDFEVPEYIESAILWVTIDS